MMSRVWRLGLRWLCCGLFLHCALSWLITGSLFWQYDVGLLWERFWLENTSRIFSLHELRQYDGSDALLPIYLAIDGRVFDVTAGKGRVFYGKGASYGVFAGRDATRAFVTGCFHDATHLTADLRGLAPEDLKVVQHWISFFQNHPHYYQVGIVDPAERSFTGPIPGPCKSRPQPSFIPVN